jgi:hypothetical protein
MSGNHLLWLESSRLRKKVEKKRFLKDQQKTE